MATRQVGADRLPGRPLASPQFEKVLSVTANEHRSTAVGAVRAAPRYPLRSSSPSFSSYDRPCHPSPGVAPTWHDAFLQTIIIGLSNGLIYALVALGYTLVYGIIELINFAHGDVFMLGSMLALTIFAGVHSV